MTYVPVCCSPAASRRGLGPCSPARKTDGTTAAKMTGPPLGLGGWVQHIWKHFTAQAFMALRGGVVAPRGALCARLSR